jgi:hypothetical protein
VHVWNGTYQETIGVARPPSSGVTSINQKTIGFAAPLVDGLAIRATFARTGGPKHGGACEGLEDTWFPDM